MIVTIIMQIQKTKKKKTENKKEKARKLCYEVRSRREYDRGKKI